LVNDNIRSNCYRSGIAAFIQYLRKRKIDRRILIAIIAGIALIAIFITYQIVVNAVDSPYRTMSDYCDALKSKDYKTAYSLYSRDSLQRKESTQVQFVSDTTTELSQLGGIINCSIDNLQQVSSTRVNVAMNFVNGNTSQQTTQFRLIKEDGNWKILSWTKQ
jgi:hypothetical protein